MCCYSSHSVPQRWPWTGRPGMVSIAVGEVDRYATSEQDRCRCTGLVPGQSLGENCRCNFRATQEDLRCDTGRDRCRPLGMAMAGEGEGAGAAPGRSAEEWAPVDWWEWPS